MNIVDIDEESKRLRYEIRLLIKHPTIDPALITKDLGLVPHLAQLVGTVRTTSDGTRLRGINEISKWEYSYRVECNRYFSRDIVNLIDTLTPHAEFLSKIVQEKGTIVIIVHLPGDANIGDTLSWQNLGRLHYLKAELGFEVFPKFDPDD